MTAATATTKAKGKSQRTDNIDQPDLAPSTLARLLDYMVGGEQRGKFILGVILRFVALLGLTALPFVTGQGDERHQRGRRRGRADSLGHLWRHCRDRLPGV